MRADLLAEASIGSEIPAGAGRAMRRSTAPSLSSSAVKLATTLQSWQVAITSRVHAKLSASGTLQKSKSCASDDVDCLQQVPEREYRDRQTGAVVDAQWVRYRRQLILNMGWSWSTPSSSRESSPSDVPKKLHSMSNTHANTSNIAELAC